MQDPNSYEAQHLRLMRKQTEILENKLKMENYIQKVNAENSKAAVEAQVKNKC